MFAEDEEEKRIYEAVLNHFNSHRVEISHAITSTFPFLHGLRDRGLITDKMFQDAEESCFKKVPVQYVVYNLLGTLEKFDLAVFEAVFSEVNLKEYPRLVPVRESFEIEVNRALQFQTNVRGHIEENSRIQLSLEQGSVSPDPVMHVNSSPVLPMDIKKERTYLNSEAQAGTDCKQASEIIVIDSEESEELGNEDQLPEASTSTAGGAELHLQGPEHENCTCVMCFSKGGQQAQPGSNQASDTTGQRRRRNNKQRNLRGAKEGTRRVNNGPLKRGRKRGTRRVNNGPLKRGRKRGTRRVNNGPLKRRMRRGRRIPKYTIAKFRGPELPVECGPVNGTLYKNLLQQGSHQKCIQGKDGRYFTLREFEIEGGYETSKNWKQTVRCLGWPLKVLIQKGFLQNPPRRRRKRTQQSDSSIFIDPYPQNSNECDVCYQGGVIYCCDSCSRSYHQDCHILHINPESYPWSCITCRIKTMWHRCWKNQPLRQESEVLQIQMQPEEQLRCEYLLLKVYQCSESTAFASKPHYGTQPHQGTQGPMWLDKIKENLRRQEYSHVGGFVQDMRLIFQNLKVFCSDEVFLRLGRELEAKFEKNFQHIFAIQETGQSMC
ncbi:nuclear body protein SP140-like protein [Ochotona princeps]|uniref:nuclear body protein SP140-like protein n=1 Tax=Ochotona princeps TaxID=9978 RepID=UPI0027148F59|nr:nuclear body protein SP140-like protein [Ochotona princeps]